MVDYKKPFTKKEIAEGAHRKRVGGKWDALGKLQIRFMKEQGLLPEHYLLDVGCGALRAGVRFVRYLEPGHYFGTDINETLLEAGYRKELGKKARAKLPRENLKQTERFESDFGDVRFDYAIAQSVFTHVSLNHIRLALYQVGKVMKPGGKFYATFFEGSKDMSLTDVLPIGRGLLQETNSYWYYREDMEWAAQYGPWTYEYIGDWNHPVKQQMVVYTRTSEDA